MRSVDADLMSSHELQHRDTRLASLLDQLEFVRHDS